MAVQGGLTLRFSAGGWRLIHYAVQVFGYLAAALAAYLIGSIPTGFLVGRSRGIDIREVGSGNIGATNTFRALGVTAGILVLLVDALKGWVAVAVAAPAVASVFPGAPEDYLRITAGVTAILGHNFTCWLHFKGGKGVATTGGVLAGLVPWTLLIAAGAWAFGMAATRIVSVGSLAAAVSLPIATWFTTRHDAGLTIVTGAMGVLAIYKHRQNIRRLLSGTEKRLQFKKKEAAP